MRADNERSTALLAKVDSGILGHVQDLFRTASRNVRTRLVNRSGVDVPVRMAMCELGALGSVLDRLQQQEGGAFVAFRLNPGDHPGLLVIQGPVLFRLVGLLLGEDPDGKPPLYRWRSLTRVDLRIARRVTEDILEGFNDALPADAHVRAEFSLVSANPRLPHSMERSVTVVETALDFGPPEDPFGLITMVIPAQVAANFWGRSSGRASANLDINPEGVDRVLTLPVTLVAELARLSLPISQVKVLVPGSEIDLGIIRDATLRVGGRSLFLADAGQQDGVRSVLIKKRLEGGESKK